ncbi:hypothetical protein [Sorangium sp. So ce1024]|uniref:hypothetical protein n=1 Tax=Sorangium sp. So ce1024 TaxID=3133327 RepID=UPI003F071277
MMFVHVTRRAQIGEVLSGRRALSRRPSRIVHPAELPRLEAQSVAAIWGRDPVDRPELPDVLVTADGQERDWIAWLTTFAPTLRPFTAFCRVMGKTSFERHLNSFGLPDLGRFENACVGLVLGEVLSSEDALARLREPLTASACASVLSFAIARELAVYRYPVHDEADLPARWSLVRRLTRQRERGLDTRQIVAVGDVLRALLRGHINTNIDPLLLQACEELALRGELVASARAISPAFERAVHEMTGTREERVAVFERAVSQPVVGVDAQLGAFSIGYLASRINPGTLAHASLLLGALRHYPSAMLWYGFCAGLSEESSVVSELGGVGRRVLRDLTASDEFIGRPRTDVSAAELEILLDGNRADEFPVTSPSQLSVELEPGVWTVVNWSSRARSQRNPEVEVRLEEREWLTFELELAIGRLAEVHRRIRGGDSPTRGPEQQILFERRPERRSKKRP